MIALLEARQPWPVVFVDFRASPLRSASAIPVSSLGPVPSNFRRTSANDSSDEILICSTVIVCDVMEACVVARVMSCSHGSLPVPDQIAIKRNRLERPKVTAGVDAEIRWSAYGRALPPRHCSAPRYAEKRRDADPDSCRPSRLLFAPGPF